MQIVLCPSLTKNICDSENTRILLLSSWRLVKQKLSDFWPIFRISFSDLANNDLKLPIIRVISIHKIIACEIFVNNCFLFYHVYLMHLTFSRGCYLILVYNKNLLMHCKLNKNLYQVRSDQPAPI